MGKKRGWAIECGHGDPDEEGDFVVRIKGKNQFAVMVDHCLNRDEVFCVWSSKRAASRIGKKVKREWELDWFELSPVEIHED